MAQSQRRNNSASQGEKTVRNALECIPDTQLNSQYLINSPSSKYSKSKHCLNWEVSPVSQVVQLNNLSQQVSKKAKPSLPKPQTEAHLVPYTFSPKSNSLSTRGQDHSVTSASTDSLSSIVTQVKKRSKVSKKSEHLYKEHLFHTFQALKFIRKLPPVDLLQLQQKKVKIPRKIGFEKKKTLVFDLDETLVHCLDDQNLQADINVSIVFPNGETVTAGVNVRPFARECLVEAAKKFEVIVFTASHQCYADAVLDHLDPKRELIHYRLYRENCIMMRNMHVKDLRILRNRKMKNLIIVDNAAYSFAYQLENGIPIISWHDDPFDTELFNLIDYLKVLENADDVREVNREVFRMNTFYRDYIEEYIKTKNC
jgi:Dullard-like phosphatase family protein